ncbi:MAG: hypothetical protein DRP73_01430, partial [Candidatus Omnitrophota bacterium]
MKRVAFVILAVCFLSGVSFSAQDVLVVADFDSGVKPNNVGGDFGAWDKDPMDFSQTCIESFNTSETRQGKGF